MRTKRLISLILCISMLLSLLPLSAFANTQPATTTIIACSDFQNESGNTSGKIVFQNLLGVIKTSGTTSADGFFCCGDYDYEYVDTKGGIDTLKDAVKDVVSQNMVFVQGNHDSASLSDGLSPSGNNDPASGDYGVFVINEDDYMWNNSNEATVKRTAQNLIEYLNDKLAVGYDKPIFVLSHLALQYNMRTYYDGDGKYAKYIFNALNEAGAKGLNIVFMYGHNHSNGWDDYLGGAAVYLEKGDTMLVSTGSNTSFTSNTLNFTYINPGYIGYYRNVNSGSDTTLTMSVIDITDTSMTFRRFDQNGLHNLKSAGVRNTYKNETAYSPNTKVYQSPRTVTLTEVTDRTPIADLIAPPPTVGERFERVTSTSALTDGGKYLLVYNSSSDYFMLPEVASKTNSGGTRIGFEIEATDLFGSDLVYGSLLDKAWTFKKSGNSWLVGDGSKYIKFTYSSTTKINATLENAGDALTVGGSANSFTFSSSQYCLNYNSRGLINGYESEPAAFYIYKFTGYTVSTKDATSSVAYTNAGQTVTVTANPAPEGMVFDKWVCDNESVTFADAKSPETIFTMPAAAVKVTATYKTPSHECVFENYTYNNDATCVSDGTETGTCVCGETDTRTKANTQLDHEYKDYTYNNDATCTNNGTETGTCTCGETDTRVKEGTKKDHEYKDYTYNNDATTESDGTETGTCVCGDTDTRIKEGTKLEPIPDPKPEIIDSTKKFVDVIAGKWYVDAVNYAVTYGIYSGTSETTFEPNKNMTRAQFVQVFANLAGVDTGDRNVDSGFTDVPKGKWFTGAVTWAAKNKVVSGMGDGTFAPNADVTRQQMCVMLVNFVENYQKSTLEEKSKAAPFADDNVIAKWAKEQVYKCANAGLVNGVGGNKFDPKASATRAQGAKIFSDFHKNYLAD